MATEQIRSPLPGTFYRKPAPDQPEFKADGESVGPEDVIGLIEVMKTFHEIKAGIAGRAIRFLAEDAEPVMAGQILAEAEG